MPHKHPTCRYCDREVPISAPPSHPHGRPKYGSCDCNMNQGYWTERMAIVAATNDPDLIWNEMWKFYNAHRQR